MTVDGLWKWLHVMSVGFFGGGLLALLATQSLLLRALDDAERRHLARAGAVAAKLVVVPLMSLGFLSGLAFWWTRYSFNGAGKLMACTPIFVHVMLLGGILALGLAQAWKGRTRKMAEAAERGAPAEEIRGHARKAFLFGGLALVIAIGTFGAATLKVPNPPLRRCAAELPADTR